MYLGWRKERNPFDWQMGWLGRQRRWRSPRIKPGWVPEIDANLSRSILFWHETNDGHGMTLVVTKDGLMAFGKERVAAKILSVA